MSVDYQHESYGAQLPAVLTETDWLLAGVLLLGIVLGIFLGFHFWGGRKGGESALQKAGKALKAKLGAFERHLGKTNDALISLIKTPADIEVIAQSKRLGHWTGEDWDSDLEDFIAASHYEIEKKPRLIKDYTHVEGHIRYISEGRDEFDDQLERIFDLCRSIDRARYNPSSEKESAAREDARRYLKAIHKRIENVRATIGPARGLIDTLIAAEAQRR